MNNMCIYIYTSFVYIRSIARMGYDWKRPNRTVGLDTIEINCIQ